MLKLSQLSKYYRSQETVTQALRRISLSFDIGEFVVITGESGSGKSTLLNVLSGLDTYEEGELEIRGEETSYYSKEDWENYRSQYIGFIFQNYNIIDSYTVYQNVVAALTIQGYPKKDRKKRAMELIERVGLEKQARQKSSTLSGGQKQRVSIARALAKDAPLIVADEPTGNLDKETSKNIIELLKEISKDKLLIMVTHDFEAVKEYATRRVRLFDGEVVEDVRIQKTIPQEIEPVPLHDGMRLHEKIAMAFRNLWAMPKRFILTLTIGLFIVFVFSLVYGSYVQTSNVINVGYHPYIGNPSPSRIIVIKRDQGLFTQQEIEDFENLALIRSVLSFDPVLELNMWMDEYYYGARIMAMGALNNADIVEGRKPTSMHEIVVPERDEFSLDQVIEINFGINEYSYEPNGKSTEYKVDMTIVGIYKAPPGSDYYYREFYFHDTFLEKAYLKYMTISATSALHLKKGAFEQTYEATEFDIRLDNNLAANQVALNKTYGDTNGIAVSDTIQLTLAHRFTSDAPSVLLTVNQLNANQTGSTPILTMSETTFATLFEHELRQIALIVTDAYDANRVIASVDQEVFHTIYPADYSYGAIDFLSIVIGQIFSFIGIIFMLSVMYFLTYLSLRNIMRARKKDYVIYRSIGAMQSDLNQITIFELIIIFTISFILVYVFLFINAEYYHLLPNFLRYYTGANYLIAVLLLLFMAVLLGIRFNKKIFKDSVITALRVE